MKCDICEDDDSDRFVFSANVRAVGPEFHYVPGVRLNACEKCRYVYWTVVVRAREIARKRTVPLPVTAAVISG